MAPVRFTTTLIAVFAAVEPVLAAVGLCGVLSTIVRQSTPESGTRMVFGASRPSILNLVVGEGVELAAIGTVPGLAGALALTRVTASMLVGVEPTDPMTSGAIVVLFGVVAVAASLIAARRASRLDPMNASREE
jgi:putative ABC transport system permease protein